MPQRRILLAAYFYPPCTDTGAHRPAAMAKYLRRLGHDVTVLTTSAYGELPGDAAGPVVRTADAQLWRARLRGARTVGSLYDSDTYGNRPHPLSKVIVPEPLALAWTPFAVRAALRLHRARPFDAVITTSPPESIHAVGRALQRRGAAWVADVRDAWNFEPLRPPFPTRLQRRLDERLERSLLGAADAVVCVSDASRNPRPPTCGRAASPTPPSSRTPPTPSCSTPPTRGASPSCSIRSAPRSSTPAASAATGATRGRSPAACACSPSASPRLPRSSSS